NAGASEAAGDFVRRARETQGLCGIFLDGENAWETYPQRGAEFLRALYGQLAAGGGLRALTISEALAGRPPATELARVHAGSWIDGKFAIWIGDPHKNQAWQALGEAQRACGASPPAREHLLVAEGSDWFWWFGEPFHSAEDRIFDHLFRARLAAAYRAAGLTAPPALELPIGGGVLKPASPP